MEGNALSVLEPPTGNEEDDYYYDFDYLSSGSDIGENFSFLLQYYRLQEERYHDFMYGLNREFYGSIRSALNTQDPLPSLDTADQNIREEESMRKATDTSLGTELVALSLRSGTRLPDYGDKSKLSCTHCKKQGHDITICFLKVGYPEWWETRHRRGQRGVSTTGSRAAVQSASGGTAFNAAFSDAAGGQGGSGPMPSMTPDQWHRLMNIIGNSNPPSSSDRLMGKRKGGLYYISKVLVDSTVSLLTIQTPGLELWHSRLGHPSEVVLKSLPFISSSAFVLNRSCETCHRAKHTRNVFFDNFNKATRLETQVYFVSRDATFYESEFPGLSDSPELLSESRGVLYENVSSFFGLDELSLGVDVSPSTGTVPPFEPNSTVLAEARLLQ
ncbi:hypothetical protein LIER_40028 [Lithospermum erythrorhizon]|uniref:GAG-pre-integrase domain-containing protein n=1 Tax=Lithospermum erythrorhizon TaxID=34254 RepID=A0AAV3QQ21_LITER